MSGPGGFVGYGMKDQCVQKVELRVSCKNLPQMDITSASDPCAVLYCKTGDKFQEVARTENISNNLNPDFATPFSLDYYFETVQHIRVRLYDIDNSSDTLKDDDFLGQIEATLGQVVSSSPYVKPLTEKKGKVIPQSYITITAEEVKEGMELAVMSFKARKLDNKDFMGKSDPYMEFSRCQPNGSWQVVHRTEVIKNDLNPSWRPFHLRVSALCGGDRSRPIKTYTDCNCHRRNIISITALMKYLADEHESVSRGENHYKSGHVLTFTYSDGMMFGKVQASMKNKDYSVKIYLDDALGIDKTTCECPGDAYKCSHAVALFLHALDNLSRTDTECQWKRNMEWMIRQSQLKSFSM